MTLFILILTLSIPGQPDQTQAVGLMIDERSCVVAGIGMTAVLEADNPEVSIDWSCLAQGGEA